MVAKVKQCGKSILIQSQMSQLTVGVPGNDGVRLQRNSRPKLVDSSDSEDVLIVLD